MTSLKNEARLFGLDLAPLGRDLLTAWSGMLEWPVIRWLWPRPTICVWLPSGQKARCQGPQAALELDEKKAARAKFQALVLPEDLLLRRSLTLPALAVSELESAIDLQLQALSPFSEQERVWAYEAQASEDGTSVRVQTVLTSHKLIADYLSQTYPEANPDQFEVWVPQWGSELFTLVHGFAEVRRQNRSIAWRWASALLMVLALGWVAALLVTPTVKLYLHSKQADLAIKALQEKAMPVLAEREAFAKANDKLSSLNGMFGNSLAPLKVLQLVTDALNDDASLLSLQVQGNKVNITGQAQNASLLMKQLDATPGFREVRAPAPSTKPLGASRESFTIEFTIDPQQLPSPAAEAESPAPAINAATVKPVVPQPPVAANPLAVPVNPLVVPAQPKKTP